MSQKFENKILPSEEFENNMKKIINEQKSKKNKKYKKIITIIISIITSIIAVIIFNKDLEAIVTSALLSIVFYDYIVKYIIKGVKNKTSKYNKNDDK